MDVSGLIGGGAKFGIISAVIAGITVFWGHAKGAFSRISSFVVVNATIQDNAGTAVLQYCWKHFKASRFGERRFTAYDLFVKPKNRYGMVAAEQSGKALTFFNGLVPIFVGAGLNGGQKDTMASNGDIQISFIRGTLNLDELIHAAVEEFDHKTNSNKDKRERYRVERFFGKNSSPMSMKSDQAEVAGKQPDSCQYNSYRIIKWKPEEVGHPVPEKPFVNLAYDRHIQDFQQEVRDWFTTEKWHKSKSLPWRLGAGLFGPPGTGKTSFVRAIGQELDLPTFVFDLTSMNNEELVKFWRKCLSQTPCIALFEDLDRIFDKDKNIKSSKFTQGVTLDCLLNCINGVEPADGILVFVTANDPTKLDDAMGVQKNGKSTRPGRLDRAVYFGPLTTSARWVIANRILSDCPDKISETVVAGKGETGAQFEQRCGDLAKHHKFGTFKVYALSEESEDEVSAST